MDAPDGVQVDHINRNKLDNRRVNLRFATSLEQQINIGLRSDNTSGFRGVCWCKRTNKFQSYIKLNGINHYLGRYTDIKHAIEARCNAEVKLYGELCPHAPCVDLCIDNSN